MRKTFAKELFKKMKENKDIYLLVGDLGYGVFDEFKQEFSHNFINVGVAEQGMIDVAAGLAQSGKTVFCYSITPFLLYRAFEQIRLADHDTENINLVGGGRDDEYGKQGFTHWCMDEKLIFKKIFKNFEYYRPREKRNVSKYVKMMIRTKLPCFLSLSRY